MVADADGHVFEKLLFAQPAERRGQGRAPRAAPRMQRLIYQLPKPRPDGQTVLSLTPLEFLERLATLIPPPRRHRRSSHGVLACPGPAVTARAGLPNGGTRPSHRPSGRGRAPKMPRSLGRRPVCLTAHEPSSTLPLDDRGRLKSVFALFAAPPREATRCRAPRNSMRRGLAIYLNDGLSLEKLVTTLFCH